MRTGKMMAALGLVALMGTPSVVLGGLSHSDLTVRLSMPPLDPGVFEYVWIANGKGGETELDEGTGLAFAAEPRSAYNELQRELTFYDFIADAGATLPSGWALAISVGTSDTIQLKNLTNSDSLVTLWGEYQYNLSALCPLPLEHSAAELQFEVSNVTTSEVLFTDSDSITNVNQVYSPTILFNFDVLLPASSIRDVQISGYVLASADAVPEPATLSLLALGGLALLRRRW